MDALPPQHITASRAAPGHLNPGARAPAQAEAVLAFWFDNPRVEPYWFVANPRLDMEIRRRFAGLGDELEGEELEVWASTARGRLAAIIVLDQLSRNLYRGQARAFDSDSIALGLAREGIAARLDRCLTPRQRRFFYMPLMHAEDRAVQADSVELFTALVVEATPLDRQGAERSLVAARQHQQTIAEFGRFPGRNRALGRQSTTAEEAYLTRGAA